MEFWQIITTLLALLLVLGVGFSAGLAIGEASRYELREEIKRLRGSTRFHQQTAQEVYRAFEKLTK